MFDLTKIPVFPEKIAEYWNTFGVYLVCSKMHMLFLSAGFCRRIYNTFMLTSKQSIENREQLYELQDLEKY